MVADDRFVEEYEWSAPIPRLNTNAVWLMIELWKNLSTPVPGLNAMVADDRLMWNAAGKAPKAAEGA